MNTPSHAILNLAFLGKHQLPQNNLAIVIGAVLPDLPIFVFYFWAKYVDQLSERQIWSEAYFQPFWQNVVDTFHSLPLALIGWLIAYYYGWEILQIFCLSLAWHSLLDLPVHNDDAHRHFFPFSNYQLISPLSYWDPKHYGNIVAPIERLLVLLTSFHVFGLVNSWVGKGLLIITNLVYLISYVRFLIRLS